MKNETLEQKRDTELYHQVQILSGNTFGTKWSPGILSTNKMIEWNQRHPDHTYNDADIEAKRKSIKNEKIKAGKKKWHNPMSYDPRDNAV